MRTSTFFISALSLVGLSLSTPTRKRATTTTLIQQVPLEPDLHTDDRIRNPVIIKLTKEDLAELSVVYGNIGRLEPSQSFSESAQRRGAATVDGRHIQNDTSLPYTAVGRLYITNGTVAHVCTASLVGTRIISTASHCFYGMPAGTTWTFQPDYFDGDRYQPSQVIAIAAINFGPAATTCDYRQDWAIMALSDPLGDSHGFFGVGVYDDSLRGQQVYSTAGYPSDIGGLTELVSQENIDATQILCDNDSGPIQFDMLAAGGQSGSPIWLSGMYQTSVLVATNPEFSFASWGADWVNTINCMRASYP